MSKVPYFIMAGFDERKMSKKNERLANSNAVMAFFLS
jgi:hypothetical protein